MASESGPTATPQVEDAVRRGLLVDYGGVLTTNLFDSFRSFCEEEGLTPDALVEKVRDDAGTRELLVALEEGKLAEEDFEPRFAAALDVDGAGLIDRLFAASGPDAEMLDAVRSARAAGVRTGLVSNSWGTRRYDRARLSELFDGIVISGEVGMAVVHHRGSGETVAELERLLGVSLGT